MNAFPWYALVGVVLFGIGLHALITHEHLLRKILALNVIGSGVFLVFGAIAFRNTFGIVDPVPQALVLTGIVVAVAVTGFALALTRRLHRVTGNTSLPDEEGLE
jgi:multicomponent Na+:H+ antiporter subunit C